MRSARAGSKLFAFTQRLTPWTVPKTAPPPAWPGHVTPSATLGKECSVAGTYYDATTDVRAIIAVAESGYTRRDAFTALHELGHHIQHTTPDFTPPTRLRLRAAGLIGWLLLAGLIVLTLAAAGGRWS